MPSSYASILFLFAAIVAGSCHAAHFNAGGLYTVGDGSDEVLTIAADDSSPYESATVGATLTLGENGGKGTVEVLAGGDLTVPANSRGWRSLYVGYYGPPAEGRLYVHGEGSLATFGSMIAVGYIGAYGDLSIEGGGRVISRDVQLAGAWTGVPTAGSATVSGAGSHWRNRSFFHGIGRDSNALMTLSEGGGMITETDGYLGFGTGAYGKVIVEDPASLWTVDDELIVGGRGDGDLDIRSGGTVDAIDVRLAQYGSSTSSINVDGSGARLHVRGELLVGEGGEGSLTITEGGLVSAFRSVTIDGGQEGDGHINLATGGSFAVHGKGDTSIDAYLMQFQGSDSIRYWDASLDDWAPITAGVAGLDYTLEYRLSGELTGYTVLTVFTVPEPSMLVMLLTGALSAATRRPKAIAG